MRVAAIDVGTNTFLLLIADVEGGKIKSVLHDEMVVVRLGQGVGESRRFHPEALARAEQCLESFSKTISRLKAERVLAVATSAARDVTNSTALLAIAEAKRIPLKIISGNEEAECTFCGTLDAHAQGTTAVIDVGGGSTEIIVGDQAGIRGRQSLDIGSVRLTERFITSHPINDDEFDKLNSFITAQLENLSVEVRSLSCERVMAVAGTPTTLAALDQEHAFASDLVDGYLLPAERIAFWLEKLRRQSVAERQALIGMEAKRADVIVAGAAILLACARALGVKNIVVSTRGLRYGVAYQLGD